MSDTASSQQSSPVKKTIVLPPYPDQQLETDFHVLQTQLNNLKYKNTKLQLDLQNRSVDYVSYYISRCYHGCRPERQELRQMQKRVKQLEQELMQCKYVIPMYLCVILVVAMLCMCMLIIWIPTLLPMKYGTSAVPKNMYLY